MTGLSEENFNMLSKVIDFEESHDRPYCADCGVLSWEAADGLVSINPPGGYGRHEYLLCPECLSLEKYKGLLPRLIENGVDLTGVII